MSYRLRDHTADVGVEATGETMGAVFGAIAEGLAAAMCDEWPEEGQSRSIAVRAEQPEALLFDYLDELIYRRDVDMELPVEHDVVVEQSDTEWVVHGSYRGVPLAAIAAREIKAVTYSEMVLERCDGEWYAYVVFDV